MFSTGRLANIYSYSTKIQYGSSASSQIVSRFSAKQAQPYKVVSSFLKGCPIFRMVLYDIRCVADLFN